jgi:DegV family protein with EDD domain
MSQFVIVTDSSADLSHEMVQALGVEVLPLAFTMEGKTYYNYTDNRDMAPKEFYRRLAAGAVATTNAVNVGQAIEGIEPLLQAGKDVLTLAFSSGLSATYSSMQIAVDELAEKYPERKVYAVDTLCASLARGLASIWARGFRSREIASRRSGTGSGEQAKHLPLVHRG